MIIEFTVENYRSIKEPVTLSAVAQRQRARQGKRAGVKTDNEIAPPYVVEKRNFGLLPVLAIFGANASGKTNVVTALDNLLSFISYGNTKDRRIIKRFVPFRLDENTAQSPTRFELKALVAGSIYSYILELNQSRILLEQLDYLPPEARRFHALYCAEWSAELQKYIWENGPDFACRDRESQSSWQGDEPFVTFLARSWMLSPFPSAVDPFIGWMKAHWELNTDLMLTKVHSSHHPEILRDIAEWLQRFDTGVADIRLEANHPAPLWEDMQKLESWASSCKLFAVHNTPFGQVEWSFEEESNGTFSLFALAFKVRYALTQGHRIIVDELGANIHPNITHEIVRMFQSPVTNPKRAQLIFTTHDATMQSEQLLRRDQIWFAEKRADGSTNLYPLTDFRARNDRDIYRSYLVGRYGGVPYLPPLETLLPEEVTR